MLLTITNLILVQTQSSFPIAYLNRKNTKTKITQKRESVRKTKHDEKESQMVTSTNVKLDKK